MIKFYLSLASVLLFSCGTKINYLGTTYPSTETVEVFVTKDAVKKPFEVIGKGYVRNLTAYSSIENIQKRSVEKARLKGANAVVFEDYFVVDNTSSITTNVDSNSKKLARVANNGASVAPQFTILFLRYKP